MITTSISAPNDWLFSNQSPTGLSRRPIRAFKRRQIQPGLPSMSSKAGFSSSRPRFPLRFHLAHKKASFYERSIPLWQENRQDNLVLDFPQGVLHWIQAWLRLFCNRLYFLRAPPSCSGTCEVSWGFFSCERPPASRSESKNGSGFPSLRFQVTFYFELNLARRANSKQPPLRPPKCPSFRSVVWASFYKFPSRINRNMAAGKELEAEVASLKGQLAASGQRLSELSPIKKVHRCLLLVLSYRVRGFNFE